MNLYEHLCTCMHRRLRLGQLCLWDHTHKRGKFEEDEKCEWLRLSTSPSLSHKRRRNCVSFCGLGTPKGSSKRFPCHRVQDSNIYISCSLEKRVPQFEICRSDHSYLSQGFLPAVRMGEPMAGKPGHLLQGFCSILDKGGCDECPSHGLEVQISSLRVLWGVSNLSLILASVWEGLNVPPMKVCLSHEQAVHGVPGPDFPTSEVVLLCW